MIFLALFSFFLVVQGRHLNQPDANTCGYDSCHHVKEGFVNVHIVPHTHDDVGWLKTVDQYFYGSNTKIQYAGVQYILDSVTQELRRDPNKRFIYVETAFFWKWWLEQTEETKEVFTNFVNNGQLEFISGAWSMNDEADTNYHSTIDQFTWGLRKLNDTFGACGRPKIGWQIDPFGHSKEQASIFAQLGFDGVFLGRIDYQDKDWRFDNRTAEFVWRTSESLGNATDIFTGILYNTYSPPPGYCFDIYCDDEPIIDDPNSPGYNVDSRIEGFFDYVDNMTKVYTTNNVLITMGMDFNYQNANNWYKNLDKLIKYANARNDSKYYLLYSTPSCYLKAVYDEGKDRLWPTKDDDFFPYASDPHAYWTGYFTSRPTSKRFEREGNNFLQVAKQLAAIANLDRGANLDSLREAMGVFQHHDAITGTEKQHVANDYARLLHIGIENGHQVAGEALNKLSNNSAQVNFKNCLLRNISSCDISETSDSFVITAYNPLSWNVTRVLNVPVSGQNYTVTEVGGTQIPVQLTPIPKQVQNIPGRDSTATVELSFIAVNLPPLGYKSFLVNKTPGNAVLNATNTTEIAFNIIGVKLDESGLLSEMNNNNFTIKVSQNYAYYRGFVGNNSEFESRSSGAYIFRPTEDNRTLIAPTSVTVYDGPIVKEIHQTFNSFSSQVIRINAFEFLVEFQWLVGPLPLDLDNGFEVTSVFRTNLTNHGRFFTDSNGRQLLNRTLNERPTWTLNLGEPVAGNYYPVTSRIGFVDEAQNLRVTVLNDRAQGGSSLQEGELELMVHRRCLSDDAFGVDEALNETAFDEGLVARGSHYLMLGPARGPNIPTNFTTLAVEALYAQVRLLQPWLFLSKNATVSQFSGLNANLPQQVHILTLEPWKNGSLLLRLEHLIEKNSDPILDGPVSVNLANLFSTFDIVAARETTLAANQWLDDNERLVFKPNVASTVSNFASNPGADLEIVLNPKQIRTFVIDVQRK